MKRSILLCAAFIAIVLNTSAATVITFDPPALPGGGKLIDSWSEQGYTFGAPTLISQSVSDSLYPWNGSGFLQAWSLNISRPDNSLFGLFSVDLAEYSTVYASPMDVTFLGTRPNGSTVSAKFTLDGIIDGNGPLIDFQHFQLPDTFTGLQSISVTGTSPDSTLQFYSIDNLLVDVPEPTVLSLAVGAMLLTARRRIGLDRPVRST